jgi:ABC-2 type transport system ATP-binding protein
MYEELVHHTTNGAGITARGLGKQFGELWAVRDLDLSVAPGTVLGLLGHNGAGKTTAIRVLTTLSRPTTGSATVAGHDVVAAAGAVRANIGVVGQQAAVDGLLTGWANLEMIGRLSGLDRSSARRRAGELLEQFDLVDAADQIAKSYSGGMRRRLDLAAGLVADPAVLFLDEPTTGLDPRSRNQLWDLLLGRVEAGVTLLLTTQYLEEADRLADEVVVLDHGRAVATGTPAELKAQLAGDRVEVTVPGGQVEATAAVLAGVTGAPVTTDGEVVIGGMGPGVRLVDVFRALDGQGIDVVDLSRHRPTLDDVFLALTEAPAPAPSFDGALA